MRALLVDWMVEVQESFELNHETLYLAVKLVDLFLTRSSKMQPEEQYLTKEELQLLGASALFISAKFDVSSTRFKKKIMLCRQIIDKRVSDTDLFIQLYGNNCH